MRRMPGFTIVELLIVIVGIAILATLSYVSYNNIQQKASNASIIDAVAKTKRFVQAYMATVGNYPLTTNTTSACVTTDSGCAINTPLSSDSSLEANILSANIGTPPRSVPVSGTNDCGIMLNYYGDATLNGESRPMRLQYYLNGPNQQCGIEGVLTASWPITEYSTTGYTNGSSRNGKTACSISIPSLR